jgi:asparagine synthetase B (glutamine-hydrolysing)
MLHTGHQYRFLVKQVKPMGLRELITRHAIRKDNEETEAEIRRYGTDDFLGQWCRDVADIQKCISDHAAGTGVFAELQKKMMLVDIQTWLNDESMMRSDKMTMAWGLEQRAPFLDYRLVERSIQIPMRWKVTPTDLKHILKQIMGPYLPPHVLAAPKRGFLSPTAKWIREELKPLVHDVLSETELRRTGIFNPQVVQAMLTGHMEGVKPGEKVEVGKNYSATILWSLITFQVWHRRFIQAGMNERSQDACHGNQ